MADPSSDSSPAAPAPLAPKKENIIPVNSKLTELNESRVELLNRIQGLKQDLQSWRTKLDTQVNVYRDELSELKKTLNDEVAQLRVEFKELKNTLHQQQEDVAASLENLGLQDISKDAKEPGDHKDVVKDEAAEDTVKETEEP